MRSLSLSPFSLCTSEHEPALEDLPCITQPHRNCMYVLGPATSMHSAIGNIYLHGSLICFRLVHDVLHRLYHM